MGGWARWVSREECGAAGWEVEKPGNEVEKLRNYVRTKGELFCNNLPFIRLFLAESKGASFNIKAGLDKEVRKRYYRFLERLVLIFESGIKNKQFKKIADPYHLAVALDTVVDAFLLFWLEAPELHPYPKDPDTILNIFFKGLINP